MLSRNLEKSLHRALAYANERRHEYATLEHLLLALTEDQDAVAVLRACGVDLGRLRGEVLNYVDNELGNLVAAAPQHEHVFEVLAKRLSLMKCRPTRSALSAIFSSRLYPPASEIARASLRFLSIFLTGSVSTMMAWFSSTRRRDNLCWKSPRAFGHTFVRRRNDEPCLGSVS